MVEILLESLLAIQQITLKLMGFREELRIEGSKGPVVFVDGFSSNWFPRGLGKYLKERRINAWMADFGPQRGGIDEYVEKLNEMIEKNKIRKPVIVGYSMGGLIALRYVQKYGWNKTERIITVASPLKGTGLANFVTWACGAAKDMATESEVVKEIQGFEVPREKLVCIYGKWDELVWPRNAHLEGAKRIRLGVGGHGQLHLTKNLESVFDKYLLI